MSEWIGWVGRLRRMIYARMEELSFRTGAATVAGVLAVAATAILLTLTQGGHHSGPPRAQAGLPASSFVAAPEIAPRSPAHHSHPRRSAAAPDVHYVPGPAKTPTATPQPSPSPTLPVPRHTFRTNPPVTHGLPSTPGFPWPWPTTGFP